MAKSFAVFHYRTVLKCLQTDAILLIAHNCRLWGREFPQEDACGGGGVNVTGGGGICTVRTSKITPISQLYFSTNKILRIRLFKKILKLYFRHLTWPSKRDTLTYFFFSFVLAKTLRRGGGGGLWGQDTTAGQLEGGGGAARPVRSVQTLLPAQLFCCC